MPRPRIDLSTVLRQARAAAAGPAPAATHLRALTGFANPTDIRALSFVPDGLPSGAPLVVALHGCTQTGAGYDQGTGWSALARVHGFALLLPEQTRANNQNLCWSWFDSQQTARGAGEVASIRSAVARLQELHRLDPKRVFVTGLSAGGAMTASLLAAYPEAFAAGAILSGLPAGAAASVPEAFEAMARGRPRPARAWGDQVRAAAPHRGPWPRVAIWQGDADPTVAAVNAEQLVLQWADVHGLTGLRPSEEAPAPGYRRRRWRAATGQVLLETNLVAGLAHGVALAPGDGEGQAGVAGPHMLDVGISSTHAIAAFFGLAPEPVVVPRAAAQPDPARHGWTAPRGTAPWRPADDAAAGVGAVIRKALAAAGLLRT